MNINDVLLQLTEKYSLEIESPFSIKINQQEYAFDCLVKGYGCKNGMIVDKAFSKISHIQGELCNMGYGFSCFDIKSSQIDGFDEVLNDWGKIL